MAWTRPADLPVNRTNATPQNTTHPDDHNRIGSNVNSMAQVVEAHDYYLSTSGTGGLANVGKVVYGTTVAGSAAPGGAIVTVANNLAVPTGLWLVVWTGLISANDYCVAQLKLWGLTAGVLTQVWSIEGQTGGNFAVSPTLIGLSAGGPATVDLNVLAGGAGTASTFADVTNHRFYAIGLVA